MATGKGSVNKVILVGNVGADPELNRTKNGISVTTLNLATNENYVDSQNEKKEKTEWHRVLFWRRLAEIAAEHLKTGSKIYMEGSLRTRPWEDQEGQKHIATEIIGEKLVILDPKKMDTADTVQSSKDDYDKDDSVEIHRQQP